MSFVSLYCTFLTKAACCRNIEIVLHPTILSYIYIYIYIYIYYIYIYIIYDSKSLDVVQSLYFGSKLPSSGTYK